MKYLITFRVLIVQYWLILRLIASYDSFRFFSKVTDLVHFPLFFLLSKWSRIFTSGEKSTFFVLLRIWFSVLLLIDLFMLSFFAYGNV